MEHQLLRKNVIVPSINELTEELLSHFSGGKIHNHVDFLIVKNIWIMQQILYFRCLDLVFFDFYEFM